MIEILKGILRKTEEVRGKILKQGSKMKPMECSEIEQKLNRVCLKLYELIELQEDIRSNLPEYLTKTTIVEAYTLMLEEQQEANMVFNKTAAFVSVRGEDNVEKLKEAYDKHWG